MADARYIRAKAAANRDEKMLRLASQMANDAKQPELTAWKLAARESEVRGKAFQPRFGSVHPAKFT
jgi:hypothetical protein